MNSGALFVQLGELIYDLPVRVLVVALQTIVNVIRLQANRNFAPDSQIALQTLDESPGGTPSLASSNDSLLTRSNCGKFCTNKARLLLGRSDTRKQRETGVTISVFVCFVKLESD